MEQIEKKGNQFNLNLITVTFRQAGNIVIYSPSLEISSFGKTKSKALEMFREHISVFFEEMTKLGTLDTEMEKLGWEKSAGINQHTAKPLTPSQIKKRIHINKFERENTFLNIVNAAA